MTGAELRQIGISISSARMRIPVANRAKFDVEAKDLFLAIQNAGDDSSRIEELLARWERRVQWFSTEPECHAAPPCLIRNPEESEEEYLNRCYEAGGF